MNIIYKQAWVCSRLSLRHRWRTQDLLNRGFKRPEVWGRLEANSGGPEFWSQRVGVGGSKSATENKRLNMNEQKCICARISYMYISECHIFYIIHLNQAKAVYVVFTYRIYNMTRRSFGSAVKIVELREWDHILQFLSKCFLYVEIRAGKMNTMCTQIKGKKSHTHSHTLH